MGLISACRRTWRQRLLCRTALWPPASLERLKDRTLLSGLTPDVFTVSPMMTSFTCVAWPSLSPAANR
ncbi:MAG: hypothetical protein RIK87_07090 [Fuerstiella sp.]